VRIIAGEFRGRKLLPPEGLTTRPITDRVKQSLFDILTPMLADSRVYDCFAGTGSMGLECISRGAAAVTFFEADRSALQRLRKNIETIDTEQRCKVIAGDLFRWFDRPVEKDTTDRADLVFLDPPYRFLREESQKLQRLAGRLAEHLSPDGLLIFRHDVNDVLELPPLECFDRREYGGMAVEILRVSGSR